MLNYREHYLCRAFVDYLFDNDAKVASCENHTMPRLEYKTHTLFMTIMAKIS